MQPSFSHLPVLRQQVADYLAVRAGGIYIDATFGAGGMAADIAAAEPKKLLALDRDKSVRPQALMLEQRYPLFAFINAPFGQMQQVCAAYVGQVDGIIFDLGVSSMQLDNAARGFSFNQTAPLDMRMNQADDIATAATIINQWSEQQLADIFYRFGEEKKSRLLARRIVAARRLKPIATTTELADLVSTTLGQREKIHPATRLFQALRIAVNNELGEIEQGLAAAANMLRPGGRLVVISFHSLEDRLVKNFFKERSRPTPALSRHLPPAHMDGAAPAPLFRLLTAKPVVASQEEMTMNPRSRSAKLRAVALI